jgi:hypothetical protein
MAGVIHRAAEEEPDEIRCQYQEGDPQRCFGPLIHVGAEVLSLSAAAQFTAAICRTNSAAQLHPWLYRYADFIEATGGRTRDRTLDLSRVKGTLSR